MGFLSKLLGKQSTEIVLVRTPQFTGTYTPETLTSSDAAIDAVRKVSASRLDVGSMLDVFDHIEAAAQDLSWKEQRLVNDEISIQTQYAFVATGQVTLEAAQRYETEMRAWMAQNR